MRAAVCHGLKQALNVEKIEPPKVLSEDYVLANVLYAALNRRDYWITQGLYPNIRYPVVLGSDGCVVVDGAHYLINPNVNWGENPYVPSRQYSILGLEEQGTLAEEIVVANDRLIGLPKHLTPQEGAALPLAGMTAYRVLISKCQVKSGEKVLITGIGGGVAQMVMHFALAKGAEVHVTSSSDDKIKQAVDIGAQAGYNYRNEDWDVLAKKAAGRFDVIIDSAGGSQFNSLIGLSKVGGRIGIYGGTAGNYGNLSPQSIFLKQLTIYGSTMANDTEFKEMIELVSRYKIKPIIDNVFSLENSNMALKQMAQSSQFGKIIIDIQSK